MVWRIRKRSIRSIVSQFLLLVISFWHRDVFSLLSAPKEHAHISVIHFVHSLFYFLSNYHLSILEADFGLFLFCPDFFINTTSWDFLLVWNSFSWLSLIPFFTSSQLIAMLGLLWTLFFYCLTQVHWIPCLLLPILIRELLFSILIRKHNFLSSTFSKQPSKIFFSLQFYWREWHRKPALQENTILWSKRKPR